MFFLLNFEVTGMAAAWTACSGMKMIYFSSYLAWYKKHMKTWAPEAGGRLNMKMPSYQYRKSHCGDKTILRSSYLHNGISYTGKMTSLYWIRALVSRVWISNHISRYSVRCNYFSMPYISAYGVNNSWARATYIHQLYNYALILA